MIAVYGLWHLGCVTAACCSEHIPTVGIDDDIDTLKNLKKGKAPIFEPGLDDIIKENIASGKLEFKNDKVDALSKCKLLWITFDTPINDGDVADVDYVLNKIKKVVSYVQDETILLVSSQLPLGTMKKLKNELKTKKINLAYSPENLRLGNAVEYFKNPDRVIVGVDSQETRQKLSEILEKFEFKIIWMSIESAEMTKHAINGFLAMSVTYANELALICEEFGANMYEVSRGLKSEVRIGPGAYLSPGAAYSGGTLARDIDYLKKISSNIDNKLNLLNSISVSNEIHKDWPIKKLIQHLGSLDSKKIAILGLTYKPNTNTLRRSGNLELAKKIKKMNANVIAFDPMINKEMDEITDNIGIVKSIEDAFENSHAVIIANSYKEYDYCDWNSLVSSMKNKLIIDANGHIYKENKDFPSELIYKTVGV